MAADNEVRALLSLAAKRGLIAQDNAAGIKLKIESGVHGRVDGAKPVAELLVKEGHITAPQADLLLSELAKTQGPKVVGGHQLVAKLGQGGMGAVYRAIQLSMQREVALKVLTPALARDQEFIERFIREARAAGKVIHPNVISCFDVGIDHGVAYMSLELVSGGDAFKRMEAAGGRLPEREAVAIVRDCARGLTAIARAGLIHRDIKPANIFLAEDGSAKLADLGLARSSSGDDRMTQTGTAVGSPAYMAPEQAKGVHDVDIRADIYSLGATLFHFLCGRPPFSGPTVFATVNKVINDPIPDPRSLAPGISADSIAIIRTAMAKDRAQRFATPEALLLAVETALAGPLAPPADRHPSGRVSTQLASAVTVIPGRSSSERFEAQPAAGAPARHPSGPQRVASGTHVRPAGRHASSSVHAQRTPRPPGKRGRRGARTALVAGMLVLAAAGVLVPALRAGSGAAPRADAGSISAPLIARSEPARRSQPSAPLMPAREWPPVVPTMPGPGDDDAVAVPVTVTDATPSPPAVPATKPLPTPKPPVAAPVAMPDPAKPPAPSPASVASTPVEDAAPVTERPMATEAATSEGELPAWAASGVKVVDLAMAGNLAGAALAAKPLPSEFGDAVAALQAARAALPRLYVAQQAALVAARPRLPVMPNLPDMALVGCIDKGVKFAAGEHAGTTVPWDRLGREDHAALRAALPTAGLTGEQQRLLARVTLDATNLATADASDPVVAAFQHLARLKAELASAAQRERDAARRREALLGELAADWKALDPRAQRLLGNLATVTTGEPMVISGPIDRRIELRGFVVIRADATMVAGGELIPCPGALVLNGSPKANYEATQVEGDAFVSCSVHAGQTFFHHGFERGRVMANAVFYGSVLIDPVHSPRFRDCAFIGGTGPRDVVSWEKSVQRDGQVLHCDFHRLRLLNALAIAASDKCAYSACELVGSPSEIKPRDICAWDPKGVLQAQLDARGVPVRVHPQGGREQTMLGPDVAAVAKALDKVVAVWGPKALGW